MSKRRPSLHQVAQQRDGWWVLDSAFYDLLPVGYFSNDATGMITEMNATALRWLGYGREEVVRKFNVRELLTADCRRKFEANFTRLPDQGRVHEFGYEFLRKDGTTFVGLVNSIAILDEQGRFAGGRAVTVDVTERQRAEERLLASEARLCTAHQRLQELSSHLQQVREEERTNLARELHDELGATLSTIKMYLGSALETDASVAPEALQHARLLLDSAMVAVRRITTDLRPSILDHHGLWEAIDWMADELRTTSCMGCRVELDQVRTLSLDEPTRTAVFRIVQESLRNAVRHAVATEIRISAHRDKDSVTLLIEDNGRGLSEAEQNRGNSWGIVGMRERARALGGELRIDARSEKGTRVELRFRPQRVLDNS